MPQSVLKRAEKLFRRRKFASVIRLLEGQIFRFRESHAFYSLLGRSCLYSGDTGGAVSYLKRADQLKADDPATLLGLAAAAVKRADVDEALDLWLKVVDLDPGNRTARRGLQLLRAIGGEGATVAEAVERVGFRRLLPPIPANPRRFILPLVGLVVLAGALAGLLLLPRPSLPWGGRRDVPDLVLTSGQPSLTAPADGSRFVLTDAEVQATFERAKRYLQQNRDNPAVREINRLLLSNASAGVKEKTRLLLRFLATPDFSTVREPFPYEEVGRDPPLYHGGFAVWRGKAANVKIGEKRITFDLLVGYQLERELLGVVPVSLDFAAQVENGDSVEVLGRILSESGEVALEGLSLHRILGK